MKNISLLIGFLLITNLAVGQEKFLVPEVTQAQKLEILYNHAISYFVTGISFAKTQGITPSEYGKYIGKEFIPYWDKNLGFDAYVNKMIYLFNGFHSNNEMQIINMGNDYVKIRLKNVDLPFKQGPMLGVTYDEFLECSYGILSQISEYMNVKFSHNISDQIWYEANFEAK